MGQFENYFSFFANSRVSENFDSFQLYSDRRQDVAQEMEGN